MFWGEAGYFDAAAELKPLLHLWSLGVEEQFYLVWPLLLLLFRRPQAHARRAGRAGGAVVRANLCSRQRTGHVLPAVDRFWELLVGGLLAFCMSSPGRGMEFAWRSSRIGRLALIFGLLLAARDFPGWWAALPALGTALLIAAGPTAWSTAGPPSRAVVFVGLISYPLYLWHWPLLSFARVVEQGEPGAVTMSFGCGFVLAWATYQFVEKPIRFGGLIRRLAVPALAVSMVGWLRRRGGVEKRDRAAVGLAAAGERDFRARPTGATAATAL